MGVCPDMKNSSMYAGVQCTQVFNLTGSTVYTFVLSAYYEGGRGYSKSLEKHISLHIFIIYHPHIKTKFAL